MKTTPLRLALRYCTTASVNVSQPLSLCELALWALTVNTAFSNNTPDGQSHRMEEGLVGLRTYSSTILQTSEIPCLAHPVRSPCLGCWNPSISKASSLYMFSKLEDENR